jgi:hypothetical protein
LCLRGESFKWKEGPKSINRIYNNKEKIVEMMQTKSNALPNNDIVDIVLYDLSYSYNL